ncbi:MAG: TrbI/VirB10 family protein [Sphingobacteriia bacterium]|nr:TrbI/VirB10 family protein [Sphingobacteriia bacterium]
MDKTKALIIASIVFVLFGLGTLLLYLRNVDSHNNNAKNIIIHKSNQKEGNLPEDFFPEHNEEVKEEIVEAPKPEHLFKYNEIDDDSIKIRKQREELIKLKHAERARQHILLDSKDDNKFILRENQQSNLLLRDIEEPIATTTAPINLKRTLVAGSIIDVTLYNETLSTLSGKILGQVSENIYASHGNKILIPRGSSIMGSYKPLSKVGDDRLNMIITKIITPDGRFIKFTNETLLSDQEGKSGLAGELDNKLKEKYGMALLVATIAASSQLAIPIYDERGRAVANSIQREFNQVNAKSLEKNLDINPTIRVPKATLAQLIIEDNIIFPEPDEAVVMGQIIEGRK